tara:strand:+ start:880 stop:1242 length:363 start_codon:yes stop_codon:yes gene_type:complete
MDYSTVLIKNYPGKSWKMEDASDYDTLEWYDPDSKPSKADLDTKLTELQNAEPIRQLRIERNRLFLKSDWMANSDVTMSDEWKTYRQALRDLPSKSGLNPKLNSSGMLDHSSIDWPVPPS